MWNSFYNQHSLHADVSSAQIDALSAKTKANDLAYRVKDLEERLERSNLVAQALWELLRDKLAISEEELIAKVTKSISVMGGAISKYLPSLEVAQNVLAP